MDDDGVSTRLDWSLGVRECMQIIVARVAAIQHRCATASTLARKAREEAEQPRPKPRRSAATGRRRDDIEYLMDAVVEVSGKADTGASDLVAEIHGLLRAGKLST